jgi:hypothetical protein
LLEEVSYVAYHFHWPLAEILDLEHPLRRAFAGQIGVICARQSGVSGEREDPRAGW